MIIVIKTKTFSDDRKKGKDSYDWEEGLKKARGNMSGEESKGGKPRQSQSKSKQSTPKQPETLNETNAPKTSNDPIQKKIDQVDKKLDRIEKEKELRRKEKKLERLTHPKSEKIKSIMSDPKFKKGAKIAGLATLGAGVTTGAILGGIKLKKKIDEKRSNEKIKNAIANDDDKD